MYEIISNYLRCDLHLRWIVFGPRRHYIFKKERSLGICWNAIRKKYLFAFQLYRYLFFSSVLINYTLPPKILWKTPSGMNDFNPQLYLYHYNKIQNFHHFLSPSILINSPTLLKKQNKVPLKNSFRCDWIESWPKEFTRNARGGVNFVPEIITTFRMVSRARV